MVPTAATDVFHKLAIRLRWLTLLIVVVLAAWWTQGNHSDEAAQHHIGTIALEYDARAKCAVRAGARPIVLDSGLVDGRGIAFEDLGLNAQAKPEPPMMLYVADAWEGVYSFKLERSKPVYLPKPSMLAPTTEMCPGGYCERAEYGGLIVRPASKLVLSDAHRQQLLVRTGAGSFEPAVGGPVLRSVTDVTWLEERSAFVVVDTLSAGEVAKASNDGSQSRRTGEIALVPEPDDGGPRRAIVKDLHRPVGIVWSGHTKRLYVADIEGNSEVWSYYRPIEGDKWIKGGSIWRQDVGPFGPTIRLQDMVVAHFDEVFVKRGEMETCEDGNVGDEVIVSAGPDGIYFFHSDGNLLAKYYLGRPVAGLTWGPVDSSSGFNCLYFTSGPQIGALKTRLKAR